MLVMFTQIAYVNPTVVNCFAFLVFFICISARQRLGKRFSHRCQIVDGLQKKNVQKKLKFKHSLTTLYCKMPYVWGSY
jgi:hypothetical protein